MPQCHPSVPFLRPVVLSLISLLLAVIPSQAEVIGYTATQDSIQELLLSQPGQRVPQGQSWPVDGLRRVVAIERDSDGLFYVVSVSALGSFSLQRADVEVGVAEELTALSVLGSADLALDDSGLLWITGSTGVLNTYDLTTGTLSSVASITAKNDPVGLSWYDGELYIVLHATGTKAPPELGRVDTGTGAVTLIRELPLAPPPDTDRVWAGFDIDDAGGLWLGYFESIPPIDPPLLPAGVAYLENLEFDPSGETRLIRDDSRLEVALVVMGQPSAVDVPVSSSLGLAILAALILAGGLFSLRHFDLLDP